MHTPPPAFERFSVAVITVVGLLSLALALHLDAAEPRTAGVPEVRH